MPSHRPDVSAASESSTVMVLALRLSCHANVQLTNGWYESRTVVVHRVVQHVQLPVDRSPLASVVNRATITTAAASMLACGQTLADNQQEFFESSTVNVNSSVYVNVLRVCGSVGAHTCVRMCE